MLRGIATVGLLSGASAFSIAGVPAQPTLARVFMNEPMPVESLTQSVCDLALKFGEAGLLEPREERRAVAFLFVL